MTHPVFSKLPDRSVDPILDDLDGWTKVDGEPSMKTWIEYTSEDGKLLSGCWEATTGTYHVIYDAWEFVHLIEGEIVITPDGEASYTVGPGDAFVVEANFAGTWEIKEKVLKHFVVKT